MEITQKMKDRALKVFNDGRPYCDGVTTDDPDYDFQCQDKKWYEPSPFYTYALKFWNDRYICPECQKQYLAEDLENAPTLKDVVAVIDREDPIALMSSDQKRWHDKLHIFIRQWPKNPPDNKWQIIMRADDQAWSMETDWRYDTPEDALEVIKTMITTITPGHPKFSVDKLRMIRVNARCWRVV